MRSGKGRGVLVGLDVGCLHLHAIGIDGRQPSMVPHRGHIRAKAHHWLTRVGLTTAIGVTGAKRSTLAGPGTVLVDPMTALQHAGAPHGTRHVLDLGWSSGRLLDVDVRGRPRLAARYPVAGCGPGQRLDEQSEALWIDDATRLGDGDPATESVPGRWSRACQTLASHLVEWLTARELHGLVWLIGGPARYPNLARALAEALPVPISVPVDPHLCLARGAARFTHSLTATASERPLPMMRPQGHQRLPIAT